MGTSICTLAAGCENRVSPHQHICVRDILKCLFLFCLHRLARLFFTIKENQNQTLFVFTDHYFISSLGVQSWMQNHYEYYGIRNLLYKINLTLLLHGLGSKGLKRCREKSLINPGVDG